MNKTLTDLSKTSTFRSHYSKITKPHAYRFYKGFLKLPDTYLTNSQRIKINHYFSSRSSHPDVFSKKLKQSSRGVGVQ